MSLFNQNFDLADVRSALVRIAERFGKDHKASNPGGGSSCTYAVNENGVLVAVCLIGQWFSDMGLLGLLTYSVPTNAYDSLDLADACATGSRAWTALAEVGIIVDEDAQQYARLAQAGQDHGLPWSKAVEYADARFIHERANDTRTALGVATVYPGPDPSEFYPVVEATEGDGLAEWERELLNG